MNLKYLLITLLVIAGIAVPSFFAARWYFDNNPQLAYTFLKKSEPIPSDESIPTETKFNNEKYRLLVANAVAAYRAKYAGDQTCDSKAGEQFLEKVIRVAAYPLEPQEYNQLLEESAGIEADACEDPLIGLWYGILLQKKGDVEKAEPFLKKSLDWKNTGYPFIQGFIGIQRLMDLYRQPSGQTTKKPKRLSEKALNYYCKAITEDRFGLSAPHVLYRLLDDSEVNGIKPNKFGYVLNKIRPYSADYPWLTGMIEGENEIDLAWQARGSGWSKDVTEEGWAGFRTHLGLARNILTRTWKLDKARPEAAAAMILVVKGGQANFGDTSRMWFDRAVRAQMDYPPAYFRYISDILPRWHGSHELMEDFGLECLNTERFDTDVPLIYLYCLRRIAGEQEDNRWRSVFRDEDVHQNLQYLFENLVNTPARRSQQDRLKTQWALVEMWCGAFDNAHRLLDETGKQVDLIHLIDLGNGFWSWSGRDWSVIEAELRAFTGPDREALEEAEQMLDDYEVEDAAAQFEEIMQKYQNDPEIFAYLRDRIAIIKMGKAEENVTRPLLAMAVRNDSVDAATFLLDNRVGINSADNKGWTALHIALNTKKDEMAELLINRGADVNVLTKKGWSPLSIALYNKQQNMAALILQKNPRIDNLTDENFSELHYACIWGDEAIVSQLIERGSNTNLISGYGVTPLQYALRNKNPAAAKRLIEKGADIHLANKENWTALHYALSNGQPDIAITLINAGADVNAATGEKWTPLHFAAYYGYEEAAKYLLARGCDTTAKLPDGDTPLMIAKERNMEKIVLLLSQKRGRL